MRAVIQRVKEASVHVGGVEVGAIGPGLLVFLGVDQDDSPSDVKYMAQKIPTLRIFNDAAGKFNVSLEEMGGSVLLVSQFTLHGDCRKGRRPSFVAAARPEKAIPLYEAVAEQLRAQDIAVATGQFGAHMDVALINDGPVTMLLDSRKLF